MQSTKQTKSDKIRKELLDAKLKAIDIAIKHGVSRTLVYQLKKEIKTKKTIYKIVHCKNCGYNWVPVKKNPKMCARCQSLKWNLKNN